MGKNEKDLHILIAEDDPEDFLLFEMAIHENDESATISHAHNGRQLMEFLQPYNISSRLLRRHEPDIIITDVRMPFAGGLEVLKHVRARQEYEKVPVVVFSTLGTDEEKQLAGDLGATRFYRKPHTFMDLKEMIAEIISEYNSERKG